MREKNVDEQNHPFHLPTFFFILIFQNFIEYVFHPYEFLIFLLFWVFVSSYNFLTIFLQFLTKFSFACCSTKEFFLQKKHKLFEPIVWKQCGIILKLYKKKLFLEPIKLFSLSFLYSFISHSTAITNSQRNRISLFS